MKDIIIQSSSIAGRGLFAAREFKKGETIFCVRGSTIKYPSVPDWHIGQKWLNVGPNTWKIAYWDGPWKFINHSCAPNSGLRGKTKVVAMRPICRGEEVTIDYSCTEASTSRWRMVCRCGSSRCRKIIRTVQFLPEKLFKKYQNYIPNFLQKEYLSQKVYEGELSDGTRVLFAKGRIKKGEILYTVKGPIIYYPKAPRSEIGFHWLGIRKNTWLIPQRESPWWVMRHSCQPNVGLKDQTKVVAMRTIFPHEEVTIDDSITEADPNWRVDCRCGSSNCRREIRSIQYLPEKLFRQYQPFIPKFFQETYRKSKLRA